MKNGIFIFTIFLLVSCDSVSIRYQEKNCMKHSWGDDVYMVERIEGLDVFMKNMSGGNDKVISKMDRGWSEVSCH